MANKPSVLEARFAVDGSNVDSPLIGAGPLSGLRDAGYALNATPKSSDFDYLYNKYYRWLQYLNDGQFSGPSSFDETLFVGGKVLTLPSTAFTIQNSRTFTADNTTETFTSVGHGMESGDGPIQVSNSGGALPAGIAAATNYYPDVVTSNTFRLYDSQFGNLKLISTNGTGTQTLTGFRLLSLTAHGLLTGDGPVQVSNAGGALPTGLVAATDYWVIKLTADTFKLATSRVSALIGQGITISGSGTGTQSIFSSGGTRNANSVVVGSVQAGNLSHDGRTHMILAAGFRNGFAGSEADFQPAGDDINFTGQCSAVTAFSHLSVGDRLTAVTVVYTKGALTFNVTVTVKLGGFSVCPITASINGTPLVVTIANIVDSTTTALSQMTLTFNHLVRSGDALGVIFSGNNGHNFSGARVTHTRPGD